MKYYIEFALPPSKQVINATIEAESIDQAIAKIRLQQGIDTPIRIINVSEIL